MAKYSNAELVCMEQFWQEWAFRLPVVLVKKFLSCFQGVKITM